MRIVHKNSWYRIKIANKFYINIRFLIIIPVSYISYDDRTVDKFFNYLISDTMWDECYLGSRKSITYLKKILRCIIVVLSVITFICVIYFGEATFLNWSILLVCFVLVSLCI